MKPAEYLDTAKARLNIQSDYELARRLGVKNGPLCQMRTGDRNVPLDVAFRLAIVLELDPAQVVADLESQREKNPDKRAFWAGFISRAALVLMAVACTLVWSFSGISGAGAVGPFGGKTRRSKYA